MTTANPKSSKSFADNASADDGKAEHNHPRSMTLDEINLNCGSLIGDQMFSLLQLESDLSDANSVVTCTKAKLKIPRKQRDLTILDAIIGPRSPRIKNVSSKNKDKSFSDEEKVYIQRRNAALDEYMGSKCQVVPINKDPKKTLFKDNTTLHQTIKGHTGAIWALKFAPDGKYLATGGQDGKLIVWTVGQPIDGLPSPASSRKGSDASGASNSHSVQSSEAEKDEDHLDPLDDFNSSFNSAHDSERRTSGNSTGFGSRPFNVSGSGVGAVDADRFSRSATRHTGSREMFRDGSKEMLRDGSRDKRDGISTTDRSRSPSPLPNRPVVQPLNQPLSAPVSISVSPPPGSRASSGKDGLSSAGSSRQSSYVPEDDINESSEEKRMGDYQNSDRESGSFDRFDEVLEEDEIKTIPLIWPTPFRTFVGHTLDVIDISWSKSHFILSASADHNVRLWHVTRGDCLQVFRHPDIATSIDFHPLHDRYFVSGCFDRKLRIWDIISDTLNKEWVSLSETVTSVCFSADGQTVVGGLMTGQVYFYNYEGLKFFTQMDCRNKRGKFKRGSKVTGLTFLKSEDDGSNTPHNNPFNALPPLLVTTNDNRLRLFSLGDYSLRMKYKGLKNTHMQIKANFSDDGKYIVCGSEMGGIVIWETTPPAVTSTISSLFGKKQDRNCSAEMIISNINTSDPELNERSGLDISRLIGQRNKKRIQSAFLSFRKNKNSSQSSSSTDSSGPNVSVATTTAVFAPASAILHCARNCLQGECSPCSNNTSVKSNIPSESSGHYQGVVQNLPDVSKGKGYSTAGVNVNENTAKIAYMKAVKSLNTDTKPAEMRKTPAPGPLVTQVPAPRVPSPVSGSLLKRERDVREVLQLDVDVNPDASGESSGYPRSLSPGSEKTDDANLFTPTGQPNYPVADLSSRVIVATDALGFIRVFVRTGQSPVDTKKRSTENYNFMI